MLPNRQAQQSLLAYLRHELCTPINGMIGYSELLLEVLQTQKESSLFQDVQNIHACSQQLLKLVTAILDPMQLERLRIDEDLSSVVATLRMELVTPLSTIVGYCEMLLEEAPAELIPDLDSINASAQQLLASVNDILHLAQQQLQTLKTSSTPERFETLGIDALVESAILTLQSLNQDSSERQTQGGMILVVDDNPTNRNLLARQLKRQGYTVSIATNAQQALRLLQATPHDLILLDVVMPGMNGIELLQQLKQHDRFQHIPVMMLSALDESESAVKRIELGAEDYVQKPFDSTLLKAKIEVYLEKKRLQNSDVQPETRSTTISPGNRNSHRLENLVQSPNQLSQLALIASTTNPQPTHPGAALQRLLEGNQRFVDESCQNPQRSRARLQETAAAQSPFAAILGCADSLIKGLGIYS